MSYESVYVRPNVILEKTMLQRPGRDIVYLEKGTFVKKVDFKYAPRGCGFDDYSTSVYALVHTQYGMGVVRIDTVD